MDMAHTNTIQITGQGSGEGALEGRGGGTLELQDEARDHHSRPVSPTTGGDSDVCVSPWQSHCNGTAPGFVVTALLELL